MRVTTKALGLGLLVVVVATTARATSSSYDQNDPFVAHNNNGGFVDQNNNGIDDIKDMYNAVAGHEVIGNAPYGAWVMEPDASCGTGADGQPNARFNRLFYGSTIALNSIAASDPTNGQCDDTSEGGPGEAGEDLANALVFYHWTTWPAGHPEEGLRCDDQGLGSITLSTPIDDPDDQCLYSSTPCSTPTQITSLFICKITTDWDKYELAVYTTGDSCDSNVEDCSTRARKAHPFPYTFATPANIARNNFSWLSGISRLQTWGCDWIHVAKSYCYEPNSSDISTELCNPTCFMEHGCGFEENEGEFKQLNLQEMVIEIELDPTATHPPDVYLFKPSPHAPDGFPEAGPLGIPPHAASDWFSEADLEGKLNGMISILPQSLKYHIGTYNFEHPDLLIALSTDNFGSQDITKNSNMFVLFDDHAEEGIWTVHNWQSGAYQPEDRLDVFRNRGNSGGGTWALLTVDDCDDTAVGKGAEVVTWQIHFVCVEQGGCIQNRDDGGSGSGSGDPHMVGFRGQKFDYHGLPGEFFNVLSTTRTQLNAFLQPELLDGLTYMGSLGLQTDGGSKVQISAIPGAQNMLVELNDRPVEADAESDDVRIAFIDPITVEVTSPELVLVVSLHKEEFIDVKAVELRVRPEQIHGVLGNTVNLDENTDMTGEDADYFVSHIWATDFKHNVFTTRKAADIRSKYKNKKLMPATHSTPEEPFQAAEVLAAKMINFRK